LTGGRIGWNVVTSLLDSAARNILGRDRQIAHDERYAIAQEFLEVTYKLWEGSWGPGAVVRDPLSGVFTDPSKMHGRQRITLRDYVGGLGGFGGRLFVGSGRTVADDLESYADSTGVDGFNIAYHVTPEASSTSPNTSSPNCADVDACVRATPRPLCGRGSLPTARHSCRPTTPGLLSGPLAVKKESRRFDDCQERRCQGIVIGGSHSG
jgi:alkanesulfonate monooxygenase SsuD/methylene tetrahydromethanopterin reductase-like flavin-dependent oxidoreductase (luciferase family)